MEGLEQICFQIISNVGAARSCYVEAIQLAKKEDFSGAENLMAEGGEAFLLGHNAHQEILKSALPIESTAMHILLMHSEDQLMSAEVMRIVSQEFIDLYKSK